MLTLWKKICTNTAKRELLSLISEDILNICRLTRKNASPKDINVVLHLSKRNRQKKASNKQWINLFLKCPFSLRNPVTGYDWNKYAAELVSCKTHQNLLLMWNTTQLPLGNRGANLKANKAEWWMNLPSTTHQSTPPWWCTGTQSALQTQSCRSWLCPHWAQPIHPYIRCHSWRTGGHSLRMHKVLDRLQRVYLEKDQTITILINPWILKSQSKH